MSEGSGRWLGFAEAVVAACLWASSGIFAVNLFRLGVPPESLALLRPVVGGGVLAICVLAARRQALKVPRRGLGLLLLVGGATVATFQVAYQFSTDAVGVPTTVAMLYLAPAIVAAASGPLLGEWPTRTHVALVVVTLLGVWLSVLGADEVPTTFGAGGLFWGVLAGGAYAAHMLFGRWVGGRYDSLAVTVYTTLGASAILVVIVPVTTGPIVLPSTLKAWLVLLAFGIATIAVAQALFFDALSRIDAGRVSIATAAEPAVAAVLATFLLSQGLTPLGWLGIALVVVGVAGAGLEPAHERRVPADA